MLRSETTETGPDRDPRHYDLGDGALLTADDERALAAAIAAGEEDARARLISSNLRLVAHIAREYRGRGMAHEDLVGEGSLGLIRAADRFDPAFGVRFSTYAAYWIREAIRAALADTAPTIRLPRHLVGLMNRWARAGRELAKELGREPSFQERAARLGLGVRRQAMVVGALKARGARPEGDGESWSTGLQADPGEGPEVDAERREELERLSRLMGALDRRERFVLAHRYGLGKADVLTLREIGARLGITREWARKLEHRALRKLEGAAQPAAAVA